MACPASVQHISRLNLKSSTSTYAEEGTAAHMLGEGHILDGGYAKDSIGRNILTKAGFLFCVDEEMAEAADVYIEYVRGLAMSLKVEPMIEVKVDSIMHEEAYGTADCVFVTDEQIVIVDYKHGAGVMAYPDKNQLKYYGALVCEQYSTSPDTPVKLVIVQPRCGDTSIREHDTTAGELSDWFYGELLEAIDDCEDPSAIFKAGDHCIFCPLKENGACPVLRSSLDDGLYTDTFKMTNDELADILSKKAAIVSMLSEVAKVVYDRQMAGQKIPGFKLVNKKAMRFFVPDIDGTPFEECAVEAFGEEAYAPRKLRSPAQLEKIEGGKSFVARHAHAKINGLTTVPLSNKKVAQTPPSSIGLDIASEYEG